MHTDPPAGLRIRPAVTRDGDAVRSLVFSVLDEHGLAGDPQGTDADLADIEASYVRGGGCFEVLEDGSGRVVGSVGLRRVDATTCELRKMYFDPSIRGRGVGRWLLQRTLDRARTLGFRRVTLQTNQALREAIALYTRFGFRPAESAQLSSRCDRAYALELGPEGSLD